MGSKRSSTGSKTGSPADNSRKSTVKRLASLPLEALVLVYRYCISPLTPATCRYTPTCSQYALEALRKYGPLKGSWLTLKRISRCHPWGGHGHDPVP